MNKSTKIIGGTFAIVMAAAFVISPALAYRGDYTQKGPDCSEERHEIMEQAFESNDYNSWKEQMNNRGRVKDVVTEENFSRFAEARRLGQAGDIAGADAIRKELGLRTSDGERVGAGYGKGRGMDVDRGQKGGQN